jgi:hypothetical protein
MAINDLISNMKRNIFEVGEDGDVHVPDDISELDEDVLPPDPAPARRAKGTRGAKTAPPKVSAATKRTVTDSVKLMLLVPAGTWALRDDVCGAKALEIVDDVTDAAVPIICRNPAMLAFFTDGAGWLEWLRLGTALAPLGRLVWSHHVVGDGHQEEDQEDVDYARYAAPSLA